MTHTYYHAQSSARVFGGEPGDYLVIHSWFDATKESFCDFRHRALRHHAEGIFECERVFGETITNSNGDTVPVRYIGEQHVREDCGGRVPSLSEWLSRIHPEPWMAAEPPASDTGAGGCKHDRRHARGVETRRPASKGGDPFSPTIGGGAAQP